MPMHLPDTDRDSTAAWVVVRAKQQSHLHIWATCQRSMAAQQHHYIQAARYCYYIFRYPHSAIGAAVI